MRSKGLTSDCGILNRHDCYGLCHQVQRDDPCLNKALKFPGIGIEQDLIFCCDIRQLWSSSECLTRDILNRKNPEKNVKLVNMPKFVT